MNERNRIAENFLREYSAVQKELRLIEEQMFDISRLLLLLGDGAETEEGNSQQYHRYREALRTYRELEYRHTVLEGKQSTVEAIVNDLNENERAVIRRYYLDGTFRHAAADLMTILGYEKSQIYRIRTQALAHIYLLMPKSEHT